MEFKTEEELIEMGKCQLTGGSFFYIYFQKNLKKCLTKNNI